MHPTGSSRESQARRAWQAGQQLLKRGSLDGAVERFQAAYRLQPGDRLYMLNLAQALLRQDKPEAACEVLSQAVRQDPRDQKVLVSLLQCLEMLRRDEDLVSTMTSVPEEVLSRDMFVSLGLAQTRLGRHADALTTWMKALGRDITDARMHVRMSYTLYEMRLKHEATKSLRTALQLGLGEVEAGCTDLLAIYEREVCDWRSAPDRMQTWPEMIRRLPVEAALELSPFCQAVLLDDPAVQLKGARIHARYLQRAMPALPPRQPTHGERIRLGYLSSDFHNHATTLLMTQLLENHDRSRFEVFLYSYGRDDGSSERARVMASAEHFVELRQANDAEMAHRIREDGIDILVDLKGYTKEARPLVMAARPAPVQVAYLGYPGTSGADFIDYLIGDEWVTPIGHAHHYSEKLALLPGCYQCNDGTRPIPVAPSRASQGLPEDALVLCGFNQLYKVSPEVFDVWCRLLHRLPKAVLWLLQTTDAGAQAIHREAGARGIDPARVIFAQTVASRDNLDRLACADLFIDTWPCNGHTSASDALWAGLPVVTLTGETFASRVAGSLLDAVGTPELACRTVYEYQDQVIALACDEERRSQLRARLRDARRTSALFNGGMRAGELESLYTRMWARAVSGLAPEHLLPDPDAVRA